MSLYTDLDTAPRILLGPGPSMVPPRVLRTMATPVVGHMDPQFLAVMDDVKELLRSVFVTQNELTVPVSGTGSAGMEAALVNFIEPGDPVLVCHAGYFGERIAEIASRTGAELRTLAAPWGEAFSATQIAAELRAHRAKLVAIVHGETSTGVQQPLEEISEVVHAHGALLLVDAVASLGGVPFSVDTLGADICYTGSQKCLSCPPGLAPITVGSHAVNVLADRHSKVQSWYLDLSLVRKYWGTDRVYHHTAPVNLNYALREALRVVCEEGLENVFARHAAVSEMLWQGLEDLGLTLMVSPDLRLRTLTTVRVPDGVDDAVVRRRLLHEFNIEIAGGLGAFRGKAWRIGLMGHSARPENVLALLGALERLL